jgi:hypothetical protein
MPTAAAEQVMTSDSRATRTMGAEEFMKNASEG